MLHEGKLAFGTHIPTAAPAPTQAFAVVCALTLPDRSIRRTLGFALHSASSAAGWKPHRSPTWGAPTNSAICCISATQRYAFGRIAGTARSIRARKLG